ncbi:hypothetical protein [Fructobacillus papyrifericola]|uniref:Uncharacterized protein n=1 Tax=Fructobacillus papyrifericola TaxID=2713172 RepID=A0ABS5QR82_9LACO|nr:hypothetical protein [Fructobacillus papyrifericola]MBS9335710.1 hypothetical protein [Fructobacillus papyrifericola]
MATERDGLKENRESFEKAAEKKFQNKVSETHEHHSDAVDHAKHKDARYDNEAFEAEKKHFEG